MRPAAADAYGQELDAALRAMLGFAVVLAAAAAAALTLSGASRVEALPKPVGLQACRCVVEALPSTAPSR